MIFAAMNIDTSKPLTVQKKPDFVCEPGDPRVKKYGWTKLKFRGYLSIEGKTIWVSFVWSKQMGHGHYSKLVKNLHKAGFEIKVPSPFPRMEAICQHLGFVRTEEWFEQMDEQIDVWILPAVANCPK